jgi:hypothetical protein
VATGQVADQRTDLAHLGRVEPGGRLVEDENRRLVQQGRGQPHPLPVPLGELADRPPPDRVDPTSIDRQPHGPASLGPPQSQHPPAERQVLSGPHLGVQRGQFGQVAKPLLDPPGVAGDVDSVDQRPAGRRADVAADHANRGGLAGAVGAEEPDHGPLGDLEFHRIYSSEIAELLGEAVYFDHGDTGDRTIPIPIGRSVLYSSKICLSAREQTPAS